MKQVDYTTYRSKGTKVNKSNNMARVVLVMTRIDYVRYIKPLLSQVETIKPGNYPR